MIAPRVGAFLSGNERRQVSDGVEDRLNRLRTKSVLAGKPQQATIDLASGTWRDSSGDWTLPEHWRIEAVPEPLEEGVTLASGKDASSVEVSTEEEDPEVISLLFYPDGSARGLSFNLLGPENMRLGFQIVPLTGRVMRIEGGSDAS